jgi:carboxylesterase
MARGPYGVLILHGFGSSLDTVSGLEAPLKALGLPIRMPILRGHGQPSPEAMRGVTWHDWMIDAEAALEDLATEADRAIVIGHSLGGLIALTLAADHVDKVDSLVLAAAAIQFTSPLAPGRPFYFLVPLLALFLRRWDTPPIYADPALAERDINYRWTPGDALCSLLEFSQATRHRLPEVWAPALIMQSRRDTIVTPESAEIIYYGISTPPDEKRIVWFEITEHGMFCDCERETAIRATVDYVRKRSGFL